MKHLLNLIIASCLFIGNATAGNTDTKIARIKQLYQQAEATIAMADDEPNTRNTFSITIDQMFPGSGPHKENIEFFFTCLDFDEDHSDEDIHWNSSLYLVRHSFNIGAMRYYSEYLFDTDTQQLIFALSTSFDEDQEPYSLRVYLDNGKVIQTIPQAPEEFKPQGLLNEAERLKSLFQKIILESPLI